MKRSSLGLLLVLCACAYGALITNPDDTRVWQSATVGTFAEKFFGSNTLANRQAVVDAKLLDDGILTADISQTGTLIPTSWALNYVGCSGQSFNNDPQNPYSYTCSAGKNVFELGSQIDDLWFQSDGVVGNTVWDLGVNAPQAGIFISVDHGPLPLEAIESTHYLAPTPQGPWEVTQVVRIYMQGYLLDQTVAGNPPGNLNLYDGFTYVVRHPKNETFRYISAIHGGPVALQSDGDDELNGVVALDLDFVPVRPPFNECVNISATLPGGVKSPMNPILLSGRWTATAELNYAYDLSTRSFGTRGTPTPMPNTMIVFFAQDYQNQFSLNFLIDSNDGSPGSATVTVKAKNLGNPTITVFDDPPTATDSPLDTVDTYQWYTFGGLGQGQFKWTWGATTTDGLSLGPLDVVGATSGFNIEISITASTGLSKFVFKNQGAGSVIDVEVPLTYTLVIDRLSCYCGNGKVDKLEQCDGTSCCTEQCTITSGGTLCRAKKDPCDIPEYCSGTNATCPDDKEYTGSACDPYCPPGKIGTGCATNDCSYYSNTSCDICSALPECGWCCATGECLNGNAAGPTGLTCSTWQKSTCGCSPVCDSTGSHNCTCSQCQCNIGRTGAICNLYVGCDGKNYASQAALPKVDACGVCKGDNSSCMGCDGIPFGKTYDHCGVCGGDGTSCVDCGSNNCEDCLASHGTLCAWCKTDSMCHDTLHSYTCDSWVRGDPNTCNPKPALTVAQAAGLSAGIVAAIAIGVGAAVIIAGIGGKKGYDAWKKNRNDFTGANNNPMYHDDGRTGTNPFYDKKV